VDALALLLASTERDYVCTAFYKSVCQGRHSAEGPETKKKHYVQNTGKTKIQRQDKTPTECNYFLLGDESKYIEFVG
jgi:hypothetical protein